MQFLTPFTLLMFTVLLRVDTYRGSCSNQSLLGGASFVCCLVCRMLYVRFLLHAASLVQGTFSVSAVWKAGITKELFFPKAQ